MNKAKLLLLTSLLAAGACDDFGELTTDPNRPTEVHPSLLLTNIEVQAFNQVSTGAALASRYVVFTDGISESQYYNWQRADFGGYGALRSVARMMEEAERTGTPNYVALGRFFRAWHFYQLTQTFGDIPYSQALRADSGDYAPAYDRQEDVYLGILAELEEANQLLSPQGGTLSGDVVYRGDVLKWRKLVNSFRLRVLMSLSAKQGNPRLKVAEQFRTIASDPARYPIFASNADNAQLVFADRDANRYPLFNNRSVQTAFFLEESFVNLLKQRQDPRLFAFAAPERRAVRQAAPGYQSSFASYGGLDAGAQVGATELVLNCVWTRPPMVISVALTRSVGSATGS